MSLDRVIFSFGSVGTIAIRNVLARYTSIYVPHWIEGHRCTGFKEKLSRSLVFLVHKPGDLEYWESYIKKTERAAVVQMVRNPIDFTISVINMWLFRAIVVGEALPSNLREWVVVDRHFLAYYPLDRVNRLARSQRRHLVLDTTELSDQEMPATEQKLCDILEIDASGSMPLSKGVQNTWFDRFLHHTPVRLDWNGIPLTFYFSGWGNITLKPYVQEVFSFEPGPTWARYYSSPKTIRVFVDNRKLNEEFFEQTRGEILNAVSDDVRIAIVRICENLANQYEIIWRRFEEVRVDRIPDDLRALLGRKLNPSIESFLEVHPHLKGRWEAY